MDVKETALAAFAAGTYKKNLHYIYRPGANPEEFAWVKRMAGSPGISSWIIQQAYYRYGTQMQVSKQVSDDLAATDFAEASKVENVPWVAPVIEVYFEDPLLPSILLLKSTPQQLQRWFPLLDVALEAPEYIAGLMQEGSGDDAKLLSVQLNPDMYAQFLLQGETPDMATGIMSSHLSEQDNCAMSYMLNLALKAFAFASVPVFKPRPLTRKQMTHGGKPGIKGRPERPSVLVSYLPKVAHEPVPPAEGYSHEFRGRRGHIRWYQDPRYVRRQHSWDFISPVPDPKTGKYPERKIIKVRKI